MACLVMLSRSGCHTLNSLIVNLPYHPKHIRQAVYEIRCNAARQGRYLATMVEVLFFCCSAGGRRMSSDGRASITMTVMSSRWPLDFTAICICSRWCTWHQQTHAPSAELERRSAPFDADASKGAACMPAWETSQNSCVMEQQASHEHCMPH